MAGSKDFWERKAEHYANSSIEHMDVYEYFLGKTRSYLKKTDRALEIGCGTGMTALTLADGVSEMVATDFSENLIRIAQERMAEAGSVSNVRFVVANAEEGAVGGGPFDVVLAHNLLHLLADLPDALLRVNRQLKPGGLFISKTITHWQKGDLVNSLLMNIMLPVMRLVGQAPFVKLRTGKELDAAIITAGFEIVEVDSHPKTTRSRYIVARKR